MLARTSFMLVVSTIGLFGVAIVQAQDNVSSVKSAAQSPGHSTLVEPGQIKWADNPYLPKGAKRALIMGDPKKPGTVVYIQKYPANYVIPPHTHTEDEAVTVLSGDYHIGMGKTFSRRHSRQLRPGGYHFNSGGEPHFSWSKGGALVEIASNGPSDIKYVNPKDDPRNQRQK